MRKLGLIAVSLLLSMVLLEVLVRAVYMFNGRPPPHISQSLRNEWRWALRSLKAAGQSLPGVYAYHPRLGFVHQNAPGFQVNSDGMRATRDFSPNRVPGTSRMVLVGDSLTMGATVGYEDAFHRVLERDFLTDWEVLNLGTAAYGADQSLLMWEERGAKYQPDIAVLGFYHRDFLRNLMFFKGYLKPYFTLDEAGSLELHTDHLMPPDALYSEYNEGRREVGGWHYSQAYAAIERVLTQWKTLDREDADWQLMAAILRRFRDSARAAGAQPFLLIIPEQRHKVEGSEFEDIDRLALEEAERLGIPALSLRSVFHAEEDDERAYPLFREDGHLTVAGNCEMARQLALALEEEGLLQAANAQTATSSCAKPG
ncbi:MAG: hypothetical protein VX252_17850 [Myxococcota bacterium]|nr:hypothetical protein [Myxococcota bacterium]